VRELVPQEVAAGFGSVAFPAGTLCPLPGFKLDGILSKEKGGSSSASAVRSVRITMTIKPIVDVQHYGKRITVQFALEQRGLTQKYDILVNDRPVKVSLFAEEVMRWLAEELRHRPGSRHPA
jgi:hypothetical protein